MDLLKFFKDLITGKNEKSYLQEYDETREQQNKEIEGFLKEINFTEMERKQVLNIINDAHKKVANLKASLVGTNITEGKNSKYPADYVNQIMAQIQAVRDKRDIMVREKIQQIRESKMQ